MSTVMNTENTKELKLDLVALVQKRNLERKAKERREKEIAERNAKAKAYIKSVKAKKEKTSKIRAAIIYTLLFLLGFIPLTMGVQKTLASETTEPVHIICDVVETYNVDGETYVVCEMPNGDLQAYTILDAPESEIELVTFETHNQDNYESYKVVAIR